MSTDTKKSQSQGEAIQVPPSSGILVPQEEVSSSPAAEEGRQEEESAYNPIHELVTGIKSRRALVATNPEHFPQKTRPGMVSAQAEAQEELLKLESQYGHYLGQVAISGVLLTKSEKRLQEFLELAKKIAKPPPIILDCEGLYVRIAKAAEPGLGDTRLFGAGQMGLVIQEMAQVGRELKFSELASPRWEYDVLVPTFQDLVTVIRKAIRASADGDALNRSYLRMAAFQRAVEMEHSSTLVPVLIHGVTPEEVPFLRNLFLSSVTVDLDALPGKVTSADVRSFFKTMVAVTKAADASRQPAAPVVQ